MTDVPLPRAVLFDIDGTLVDSNYLHVDAWAGAFSDVGAPVDAWRIHRMIGADSSKLLQDLLGDRLDALGEGARDRHAERYAALMPRLRRFAAAREVIDYLASHDVRVVLATSAPPKEFAALREVLEVDDLIHAATTADDVETAKPEPDLIGTALERAGVEPGEAVMIGDTVWDAAAAGRAGVRTIGVLSGGISQAELRAGGAASVYADAGAILEALQDGQPL
jgi:HAD superfamily hydrolase (TIGR01509 family)